MTRQQIVTKAIKKAIKNGWRPPYSENAMKTFGIDSDGLFMVIFSHDFAKAFWGNEVYYEVDETPDWAHDSGDIDINWISESKCEKRGINTGMLRDQEAWEYHLQQQVLSDDPVKYLEKGLLIKR